MDIPTDKRSDDIKTCSLYRRRKCTCKVRCAVRAEGERRQNSESIRTAAGDRKDIGG
jgi:hypothetical protein